VEYKQLYEDVTEVFQNLKTFMYSQNGSHIKTTELTIWHRDMQCHCHRVVLLILINLNDNFFYYSFIITVGKTWLNCATIEKEVDTANTPVVLSKKLMLITRDMGSGVTGKVI
jgi:hypothetical protein